MAAIIDLAIGGDAGVVDECDSNHRTGGEVMVIDRSTIPLEMLGEPDDTECPHGIPTGMGIECWECRYEELNKDHIALEDDYAALEDDYAALEQRCRELLEAEHALSDAYIRLRSKLRAFDTPNAPTREQVWEHTEQKLDALLAENAELVQKVQELEELQYAYDNTPFAHWVEKCNKLEAENAALRTRLEPIYAWFEGDSDDGMELYEICMDIWEMKQMAHETTGEK